VPKYSTELLFMDYLCIRSCPLSQRTYCCNTLCGGNLGCNQWKDWYSEQGSL